MNYPDYVKAQQMQIQVPQYQTAQMMPMQPMESMAAMPIESEEDRERNRQQMVMAGLNPDDFGDRLKFMGGNIMAIPSRIMEAPASIGDAAKKQAKGLLDLFK